MDLRAFLSGIRLSNPSTLILLVANLVPLLGILFWGWDAFVLLILYWLETAIIGFWMLVRLANLSDASLGDLRKGGKASPGTRLGLTLFFIVHAGMFMGVHMVFLWVLFSDGWTRRIHGPIDFVRELVIGTGLWLPLLVMFIARGAIFFYDTVGARMIARLNKRPAPPSDPDAAGAIIGAFYARVVVMHCAIIFGAFLSFLGSTGPLLIMLALKTIVDLGMNAKFEFGDADKLGKALLASKDQKG